jgi:hypothetical protein
MTENPIRLLEEDRAHLLVLCDVRKKREAHLQAENRLLREMLKEYRRSMCGPHGCHVGKGDCRLCENADALVGAG